MTQSITAIKQKIAYSSQNLGHGLVLRASCNEAQAGLVILVLNSGLDDGTLNWLYADAEGVHAGGLVLRGSHPHMLSRTSRIEGQFIFADGAGDTIVNLRAFDGTA